MDGIKNMLIPKEGTLIASFSPNEVEIDTLIREKEEDKLNGYIKISAPNAESYLIFEKGVLIGASCKKGKENTKKGKDALECIKSIENPSFAIFEFSPYQLRYIKELNSKYLFTGFRIVTELPRGKLIKKIKVETPDLRNIFAEIGSELLSGYAKFSMEDFDFYIVAKEGAPMACFAVGKEEFTSDKALQYFLYNLGPCSIEIFSVEVDKLVEFLKDHSEMYITEEGFNIVHRVYLSRDLLLKTHRLKDPEEKIIDRILKRFNEDEE
ncbi:MAG: DUF2226 domain-containing protein [Candidatus Hydrothermarchaeota archaeon]